MLTTLMQKSSRIATIALVTLTVGCSGGTDSVAPANITIGGTGVEGAFDTAVKAAFEGNLAYVKQCVESDAAYAQAVDSRGRTLLHYAAEGGHADIVKYLLENGALANVGDTDGYYPMDAASQGAGTPEILTLLREAAARETGTQ